MPQIATQCAKLELEKYYQATEQYFKTHPGAVTHPCSQGEYGGGAGQHYPRDPRSTAITQPESCWSNTSYCLNAQSEHEIQTYSGHTYEGVQRFKNPNVRSKKNSPRATCIPYR